MIAYKVHWAEIKDGVVELPDGAIPLKVGLMLTGPFSHPDTKMGDGVSYLLPVAEKKEQDED